MMLQTAAPGSRRTAGLTLIELMITVVLAGILIVAIGVVMYDSHKSFAQMYRRATSDVVVSSYAARRAFEAVARKATVRRCIVGGGGESIEFYYYGSITAPSLDRYARFYRSGSDFMVEYGPLAEGTFTPLGATLVQVLAEDVTSVSLSMEGVSVSMHLTIDNGKESITVDCTAIRHNE